MTLIPIPRLRLHVRIVLASSQTTPSPAARAFLATTARPHQQASAPRPDTTAPEDDNGELRRRTRAMNA